MTHISNNPSCLEILVVDDDKVVALLHKNQLRINGIALPPVLCENGLEALEYLQQNDHQNKHFLIFLDLNMPVLDGWKFLKKLKKTDLQAKVQVVIVTSSINQKDYDKSKAYETVIYFCRKPMGAECVEKIFNLPELNYLKTLQKEEQDPET